MSHPVKIAASTLAAITLLFAGLSVAQAGHEHGFFNIIVRANINDDPAPKLQDPRLVAEFNYVRELDTPTLDAPAGWIDGDRGGYRCAYAFLTYRGWIVGRATYAYIDPPGDGNAPQIIDRYMQENVLNYDGTEMAEDTDPAPGSCHTQPIGTGHHSSPGPGPDPLVTFQHGPHTIEVRDFLGGEGFGLKGEDVQSLGEGHTFRLGDVSDERVEVIGYQDGVPVLQILYDLIAPGQVVPGTLHPVTLHVGCGLECIGHGPDHGPVPTQSPSPSSSPEPSPSPEPSSSASPQPDGEEPSRPQPGPIPGDLNGDGRVNFADLSILVENWTG